MRAITIAAYVLLVVFVFVYVAFSLTGIYLWSDA